MQALAATTTGCTAPARRTAPRCGAAEPQSAASGRARRDGVFARTPPPPAQCTAFAQAVYGADGVARVPGALQHGPDGDWQYLGATAAALQRAHVERALCSLWPGGAALRAGARTGTGWSRICGSPPACDAPWLVSSGAVLLHRVPLEPRRYISRVACACPSAASTWVARSGYFLSSAPECCSTAWPDLRWRGAGELGTTGCTPRVPELRVIKDAQPKCTHVH